MGKLAYALVALLAFALGAIAFIPAHVLETPVNRALSSHGSFSAKQGSIWSGEGELRLRASASGEISIPVRWQFDPAALARLRIGHRLHFAGTDFRGTARVAAGISDVALREFELHTTLETILRVTRPGGAVLLAQLSAPLTLAALDEGVTIAYAKPNALNGSARLGVKNLTSRALSSLPLTSFDATMVFKGSRAVFRIGNSTGLAALEGTGVLDLATPAPQRAFAFNGFIAPAANLSASLRVALLVMGRLSADGRVRIDYRVNF